MRDSRSVWPILGELPRPWNLYSTILEKASDDTKPRLETRRSAGLHHPRVQPHASPVPHVAAFAWTTTGLRHKIDLLFLECAELRTRPGKFGKKIEIRTLRVAVNGVLRRLLAKLVALLQKLVPLREGFIRQSMDRVMNLSQPPREITFVSRTSSISARLFAAATSRRRAASRPRPAIRWTRA